MIWRLVDGKWIHVNTQSDVDAKLVMISPSGLIFTLSKNKITIVLEPNDIYSFDLDLHHESDLNEKTFLTTFLSRYAVGFDGNALLITKRFPPPTWHITRIFSGC